VVYGKNFFLKLFRKLDYSINSDAEISGFLTDESHFAHMPAFVGTFQWKSQRENITLGLMQTLVENSGDGWTYVLDRLDELNEKILASPDILTLPEDMMTYDSKSPYNGHVNPLLHEIFAGPLTEQIRLLGIRTAELHKALAARTDIAAFAPEPYSLHYQRSLFAGLKTLVRSAFQNQSENLEKLSPEVRDLAEEILARQPEILNRLKNIYRTKIDVSKIRIHGDYHLGQVLFTGKDFVITDFEGEPARSYTERRLKRSPLRDVAGMIRSFHYAAYASLFLDNQIRKEDYARLIPIMEAWYHHVSHVFMEAYKENVKGTPFIPKTNEELETLMTTFLLEKAIYEMNYELNNRPDWVVIPLTGIKAILDSKQNKVDRNKVEQEVVTG
jgi:maltose alpha-D-glucosyltransferase/alpha-amylase